MTLMVGRVRVQIENASKPSFRVYYGMQATYFRNNNMTSAGNTTSK
jgi:hypothetical protein